MINGRDKMFDRISIPEIIFKFYYGLIVSMLLNFL